MGYPLIGVRLISCVFDTTPGRETGCRLLGVTRKPTRKKSDPFADFPSTEDFKYRPGRNGEKWDRKDLKDQNMRKRAYNYKLAVRLGINPDMPVPKKLDMDIIVLLLNYNRKARDNKLIGMKPDSFFPIELFIYIWRNSYILKEDNRHMFSLAIKDISRGMGWSYLKVSRGMKKLIEAGLIRPVGKAWRFKTGNSIKVYEMANLKRWLEAHKGLIPPIPANFKLTARVARWTPPVDKEALRLEKKEKRISEQKEKLINNPYWGLFLDENGNMLEMVDNNLNKLQKIPKKEDEEEI